MTGPKSFWETEAAIRHNRRDRILKELEIREIAKYVRNGMRVLDVGCGDGETLIKMAEQYRIDAHGTDFSSAMVFKAKQNELVLPLWRRVRFEIGCSIADGEAENYPAFDLIYTERCIINLADWSTQTRAIHNILGLLKPGGKYLMVEHSQEGLDRLNEWRAMVGLEAILVPSHNRYLREHEVEKLAASVYGEHGISAEFWPVHFGSTYYILSRIVNAVMARAEGREPVYDAFVNQLALKLPNVGNIGHAAIWIWTKP